MNKKWIVAVIIFIATIVGLGYWWSSQNAQPELERLSISPTPEVTTTMGIIRAGGSSYMDPAGVFTFLYPAEYKLDTQGEGQYIRIYKTGATQRGQTEMYDGVIVVFESLSLNGESLESFVDKRISESTQDGTTQTTAAKHATSINGYSGFAYSTRGLGESNNIYIQKDSTSEFALGITYSVSDPESIGFQGEVDAILATIELMK